MFGQPIVGSRPKMARKRLTLLALRDEDTDQILNVSYSVDGLKTTTDNLGRKIMDNQNVYVENYEYKTFDEGKIVHYIRGKHPNLTKEAEAVLVDKTKKSLINWERAYKKRVNVLIASPYLSSISKDSIREIKRECRNGEDYFNISKKHGIPITAVKVIDKTY